MATPATSSAVGHHFVALNLNSRSPGWCKSLSLYRAAPSASREVSGLAGACLLPGRRSSGGAVPLIGVRSARTTSDGITGRCAAPRFSTLVSCGQSA